MNIDLVGAAAAPDGGITVTVAVIVAGILSILSALTVAITTIITTARQAKVGATVEATKHTIEDVQKEGVVRNTKLDRIEVLVDGRYSEVLKELAMVRALLADRSGDAGDQLKADKAQRLSDDQAQRVTDAPPKQTVG